MSVSRLVEEQSAAEIYEWMAYLRLQNDEDFKKKIDKDMERDRQSNMSDEERSKMIINMFKNKGK
jgi:hypothetical protein